MIQSVGLPDKNSGRAFASIVDFRQYHCGRYDVVIKVSRRITRSARSAYCARRAAVRVAAQPLPCNNGTDTRL